MGTIPSSDGVCKCLRTTQLWMFCFQFRSLALTSPDHVCVLDKPDRWACTLISEWAGVKVLWWPKEDTQGHGITRELVAVTNKEIRATGIFANSTFNWQCQPPKLQWTLPVVTADSLRLVSTWVVSDIDINNLINGVSTTNWQMGHLVC